jgi:hypothetical protein
MTGARRTRAVRRGAMNARRAIAAIRPPCRYAGKR